jgi:hypothetical protein
VFLRNKDRPGIAEIEQYLSAVYINFVEMLIDTERSPRTALDSSCLSLLKARGEDGKYKTCDECGRNDVEDDSPEVRQREHNSSRPPLQVHPDWRSAGLQCVSVSIVIA